MLTLQMAAAVKSYKLGDPREAGVTLGPVVSQRSAEFIRKQIAEAGRSLSLL